MISNIHRSTSAALAVMASIGFGALAASAAETAAPAKPAPAAAAPAEAAPKTAAPEGEAAPEAAAPAAEAVAPVAAEAPADAAPAAPAAATPTQQKSAAAPSAAELALGAVVIGSDGKEVGKINRVRTGASGAVAEIHVQTTGKAGIVAVPGDKITSGGSNVKLSLTSDEVSKLPALGGGNG